MSGVIYKFTFSTDPYKFVYIGSTQNYNSRIQNHQSNNINKIVERNHSGVKQFKIVENNVNKRNLLSREQYHVIKNLPYSLNSNLPQGGCIWSKKNKTISIGSSIIGNLINIKMLFTIKGKPLKNAVKLYLDEIYQKDKHDLFLEYLLHNDIDIFENIILLNSCTSLAEFHVLFNSFPIYNPLKWKYQSFIVIANNIYNNAYDYECDNKSDITNMDNIIQYICPIHGIKFDTIERHLTKKYICCKDIKITKTEIKNISFYKYPIIQGELCKYNQINIECPLHGSFTTTPFNFLYKDQRCPFISKYCNHP